MTVARNKRNGTEAELAVLAWAQQRWPWAGVVRPRLNGRDDLGDIHVHDGVVMWVIEVKRSTANLATLTEWHRQLRVECDNVRATTTKQVEGLLIVVPKGGLHHPERWLPITEYLP